MQFSLVSFVILFAVINNGICEEDEYKVLVGSFEDVDIAASPGSDDGPSTRIIGGNPADIAQYPFTVQVLRRNSLMCGGSILTQRHILTAAHCFYDSRNVAISASQFSVRAGATYLNSGGQTQPVSTYFIHPRYNLTTIDSDVAVMLLRRSLVLNNLVAQAMIPTPNSVVPVNAPVTHVGWGVTGTLEGAPASQILMEVHIQKVNWTECRRRYDLLSQITGRPFYVTENMMCAGLLDIGGKDACYGDSGGPLLYSRIVVGITSWGAECGDALLPGVSARVAPFTQWIVDTVAGSLAGQAPDIPSPQRF